MIGDYLAEGITADRAQGDAVDDHIQDLIAAVRQDAEGPVGSGIYRRFSMRGDGPAGSGSSADGMGGSP